MGAFKALGALCEEIDGLVAKLAKLDDIFICLK
jgi:hypothetical protein